MSAEVRADIKATARPPLVARPETVKPQPKQPAKPAKKKQAARGPVRLHRVESEGLSLAVRESGDPSAPTVVLVHGYPDTSQVWDEVAERLRGRFHVVAYDVRGAGGSGTPGKRSGYEMDHLVADLGAVLDATSPDRPVHLVGHDWGSIQCWEAVTTERLKGRIASYTSISGPSLDHAAHWLRQGSTGARLRQSIRSQYITFFQTPSVPEALWLSGRAERIFSRMLARIEGVQPRPGHPADTLARDGAKGVGLYRANMRERLRRPRERRTDLPVQVIVPTRDRFVTSALAAQAPVPFVPRLWVREIPAGHWAVRSRPGPVASLIADFAGHIEGGTEPETISAGHELTGRIAVVTGAGSGIGRATALALAERGAQIIAADIDLEAAERTAQLARLLGAQAHAYPVDVSSTAAMEGFAADVRERHGVPGIVVNNAGIGMAGAFLDTGFDDWRRILGVNLWGVIHGSRLFAEQMKEAGERGHIVNVASAAAYTPHRTLSAYSTTKAAVLMLSECLRAELAGSGIGVSAICPGIVNTNIVRDTTMVGATPEEEQKLQRRAVKAYQRRGFPPEKVAEQIVAAIQNNKAVVPVTPEAKAGQILSRLSPALMRRMARIDRPGARR